MKRLETRQHIIETASELFYKNGYNRTGINEIIAEAGIAKATLYSHFRSKEELCIAYLESRDAASLQALEQICNSKAVGKQRILAVLESLIPFFERDDFNGCWCIRTVAEVSKSDEKVKAKIKAQKQRFLGFLEDLVKANAVNLRPDAQIRLAKRLYLLYEGAMAESHLQGESWPIQESILLLEELLTEIE